MNGIEKITDQITADAQAEVAAILAAAKAEAEEITAQYTAKAAEKTAILNQKGELAAAQRGERLASMAQMEARKLILDAKQAIIARAFDKALEDLTNLPEDQYTALLADLIVKASRTGREQVIFSKKDRSRFGKNAVTQANDRIGNDAMLTLAEETRPIAGGLILKDDKVETNCAFETLIHLQKDTLAAQVAKELF